MVVDRWRWKQKQRELEQNQQLQSRSPIGARVSSLEQRFRDAEKEWSKKHGETLIHMGHLEMDMVELKTLLGMRRKRLNLD